MVARWSYRDYVTFGTPWDYMSALPVLVIRSGLQTAMGIAVNLRIEVVDEVLIHKDTVNLCGRRQQITMPLTLVRFELVPGFVGLDDALGAC